MDNHKKKINPAKLTPTIESWLRSGAATLVINLVLWLWIWQCLTVYFIEWTLWFHPYHSSCFIVQAPGRKLFAAVSIPSKSASSLLNAKQKQQGESRQPSLKATWASSLRTFQSHNKPPCLYFTWVISSAVTYLRQAVCLRYTEALVLPQISSGGWDQRRRRQLCCTIRSVLIPAKLSLILNKWNELIPLLSIARWAFTTVK